MNVPNKLRVIVSENNPDSAIATNARDSTPAVTGSEPRVGTPTRSTAGTMSASWKARPRQPVQIARCDDLDHRLRQRNTIGFGYSLDCRI